MNQDLPYDRFLMAQLAGDLMNDASLLPATGLLGWGPWYYGIAQPGSPAPMNGTTASIW